MPSRTSTIRSTGGSIPRSRTRRRAVRTQRVSRTSASASRRPGIYPPRVSQPEVQRQAGQQRGNIDALSELVEGVDQKLDGLEAKVDCGFEQVGSQLEEVLRLLNTPR